MPRVSVSRVAAAAAALVVGAGIVTGAIRAAQPQTGSPLPGPAAPAAGAIGSPVRVDGLTVTVVRLAAGAAPPPSGEVTDAERFLTVGVVCRSAGSETVPVSPYDWVLVDADGEVYVPVVDGLGGALPERVLEPGQSAQGLIGFTVPATARGLRLRFDAELGDESASVPLT
jgi:hypothetical protein